jgi:hypothetical protein
VNAPRAALRRFAIALLVAVSLAAVTTRLYASDEVEFFAWLHSWTFDRDVDFENEYQYFYDTGAMRNALFHETFLERVNERGLRHNFTPIGCALLWAPFYAIGHAAALVSGAPADGLGHPYVAAVAYGSALYGLAAIALSAAIARRIAGEGWRASLAVWIGTPLIFYMYVAPGFSHACSAFAVALFLFTWLRVRDSWTPGGAALLGASGALMAMVREQDLFFVIGPALDFLRFAATARRAGSVRASHLGRIRPAAVATAAAGFLLVYWPQLLAYRALNGHLGPDATVRSKMIWSSPHGWQVLFSPEHGLFAWTPLALVAVAGLVWMAIRPHGDRARDVRWLATLALVMIGVQAYVSGCVDSWSVAGSFGQRRFVALTPLLAVGIAALFTRARRPLARAAAIGLVVACVWWNLGLVLQFSLHEMDRQRLTLRANARATFVDLPVRAPSIVWQYLTDRSAFYGRPRQ